MDRDAGQKLWKFLRKTEDDVVRHEHRAEIVARGAIGIVNPLMREQNDGVHGRIAHELREMLRVNRFQVAFERARWNAELAEHETGEPAVPPIQAEPAAGT